MSLELEWAELITLGFVENWASSIYHSTANSTQLINWVALSAVDQWPVLLQLRLYKCMMLLHVVFTYRLCWWTWDIQVCFKTARQQTTSLWTNNSNSFCHRFFFCPLAIFRVVCLLQKLFPLSLQLSLSRLRFLNTLGLDKYRCV